MVELFLDGGPFMYPILLLLLGGLALVVERFRSLAQSQADSEGFMEAVSKAIKAGGTKKALSVCDGHDGPVSNICKAGLEKSGKGADQVEKAIENAGSLEMAFLEKNMGWLTAIVAIAPMMGFTGTVWGMIGAFEAKNKSDWRLKPGIIIARFGEPILSKNYAGLGVEEIRDLVRDRIKKLIKTPEKE